MSRYFITKYNFGNGFDKKIVTNIEGVDFVVSIDSEYHLLVPNFSASCWQLT